MTASNVDEATLAFLHVHGIRVAPADLESMIQEAVEQLPRTLISPLAASGLSEQEVAALERGGFDLTPRDWGKDDPLARTAADLTALLRTGLSTADAARRLQVDPSRVRQRLTSRPRSLYGIRTGRGWRLPLFQFDDGGLVPGIEKVFALLDPELDPVSVFRWFMMPCPDLVPEGRDEPLSPLDWLRLRLPVEDVGAIAEHL